MNLIALVGRRFATLGLVLPLCCVSACAKSVVDPPPPVASNELAAAPPGARGAHAAFEKIRPLQVEEAAPRAVPGEPDPDSDDEPSDAGAGPPTPAKPEGVAL